MNRVAQLQADRNAATRPNWDLFEPHRRRVTELLLAQTGDGTKRLCVLGAGNANDLDLARLLPQFAEVHLVDLDATALAEGQRRQALESGVAGRLHLHGGVDVTGVAELLSRWTPAAPPSDDEAVSCVRLAAEAAVPTLPAPFDVVASVCLLTQLADSVVNSVGQQHARFVELLLAVRTRHVRLLVELLAPGGAGLLITDVVSSDTCPELKNVPEGQLAELLQRAIAARNFFHGANPFVLAQLLRSEVRLAPLVGRVELLAPWRWNLGPRVYAVCAVVFSRS